jgi:hypothetical protein
MVKTNLFWVVLRQLTNMYPILKEVTLLNDLKISVQGLFDLKKTLKSD